VGIPNPLIIFPYTCIISTSLFFSKVEDTFKTAGTQTIKFLEKNVGENLEDIGFGNYFLDKTPKPQNESKNRQIGLQQT
jgi:hypothetical protein